MEAKISEIASPEPASSHHHRGVGKDSIRDVRRIAAIREDEEMVDILEEEFKEVSIGEP